MDFLSILIGKTIILFSRTFNLGSGSTWPGHIALKLNQNFCRNILSKSKAIKIVVAGTNGKTTTGKLIASVLKASQKTYAHNVAGANLLNGLASELIQNSTLFGRIDKDYLIFESDEFALPQILENVNPDYLICLNLFRDQLDRYGELDSIAKRWKNSIDKHDSITLILNADDPLITYLGENRKNKFYFGLDGKENLKRLKHGADSIFCPKCSTRLTFEKVYFSHLGIWRCGNCQFERPKPTIIRASFYPLDGIYNKYNTIAANLLLNKLRFNNDQIVEGLKKFKPAFGRQEKISYKGKAINLFLAKNPTSFNESLATIMDLRAENILIVLNDRIPDGLDVSWIWDIGIERILDSDINIMVSGDRTYDMALRLKYAGIFFHSEENLENAINSMVDNLDSDEKLYVLPNYSAMLDVRKILLGRKLL
ncbi:MAG: hypothetical protein A2798_02345 [Candidatus Levybacteria bacterium RIFCSPHIGHO2_01_FULL_37_17]|nr:MAG: hypothetical protein A2798_02345 [Candidatus Levybacteria bacterium RIFCSPHIGHO2_01_FULL_37_17]OGH36715.1 MAG: hypothetical protein A2959_00335 [Candidatus Levybacteria bacterium RIFCSPLOWO2_01_FULL_38_23]